MSKQWEAMDLKGGGLQQVQMAYKSVARTKPGAYLRWILFPLGVHRFYLLDRRGGLAYLGASLAALVVHVAAGFPWLWLVPSVAALVDLFLIPGRLVRINKELRLQTMMSGARPGAPRGFKGHYTEENTTGDGEDGNR
ncbi:MAG: hypothetical protein ACLFRB_05035 [Thiohalorhabdus sp.]|uniref:hypothetical protein n=1 Tax=Thiohalorhabdus sp. TaxID=3094134 RepID=UPI00397FD372